jgi:hypothetical protein
MKILDNTPPKKEMTFQSFREMNKHASNKHTQRQKSIVRKQATGCGLVCVVVDTIYTRCQYDQRFERTLICGMLDCDEYYD